MDGASERALARHQISLISQAAAHLITMICSYILCLAGEMIVDPWLDEGRGRRGRVQGAQLLRDAGARLRWKLTARRRRDRYSIVFACCAIKYVDVLTLF
eukprot:1064119-Pleurochrysis_carterae.AAC.2